MKNNKIDPYFVGYKILSLGFKEHDFYSGISKALFITKLFTSSTDAILYKLKKDGLYHRFSNSKLLSRNIEYVTKIVNNKIDFRKDNDYYKYDIDDREKIFIIPIIFDNYEYVLVLLNPILDNFNIDQLSHVVKKSFIVILSKMNMYYMAKKKSEKDALTGVDNRLMYNNAILKLSSNPEKSFSFVIMDLFRLKYVNDNLGYSFGDMYIKKAADIIQSVFPKYKLIQDTKGNIKKIHTGDYVFRIGGDEFAVISFSKTKEEMENIIDKYICNNKIQLPIQEDLPLYINYGISERINNENPEIVFKRANDELSYNKRKMYEMEGLERRK